MDASQQKTSKQYDDVVVDRLSSLPDVILCKIVSYLPTKNAIATTILSTKWKNISPFLAPPITIDLDDSLLLNPSKTKSKKPSFSFAKFVDKLIHTTLSDVAYEVLILKCQKYYGDDKIECWIFPYLPMDLLRELVLSIRLKDSRGFFHCLDGEKLTRLELGKKFKVRVPSEFTLPNLRVLVLIKLIFEYWQERNMFSEFISGCPALEELCLSKCEFLDLGIIRIKSGEIKKLTIKENWVNESGSCLDLDVPNLEVLHYDDCFSGEYCHYNFRNLLFAHIDVGLYELLTDDDPYWYSKEIVTSCSSTISLSLATEALCALQRSDDELPVFQNLTCLALGCVLRSEGWILLAKLLCNAPNLERLTLEEGFGMHEEGYSSFVSILPEPPICLEARVKKIEFKVFREEDDEIKLVEYFLNNGNVIQKLQLCCMPFKKTSTLSRLLMLPRYANIDFQPR